MVNVYSTEFARNHPAAVAYKEEQYQEAYQFGIGLVETPEYIAECRKIMEEYREWEKKRDEATSEELWLQRLIAEMKKEKNETN